MPKPEPSRGTNTAFLIVVVLCLRGTIVNGQQMPNRLAVTSGAVNAFNSTGTRIEPGQPLIEGEKVRTGESSFAILTISNAGSLTVEEKTHIEVLRLGANPIVRLETGTVKVSSDRTDLHIMTRSGVFSAAEWPYAAEFTVNEGGVNISVTEGAVRVSESGTGLTVRSPAPSRYRTYVVGGNHIPDPPPVLPPGAFPPCPGTAPPASNASKPGSAATRTPAKPE